MVNDKSFYEDHLQSGLTPNGEPIVQQRIADSEHAHDIANTLRDHGTTAADAREAYLKSVHESGGFTPDQQENMTVMDGLHELYPQAFHELMDQNGRKFLLSREVSRAKQDEIEMKVGRSVGARLLLTPYGFVKIAEVGVRIGLDTPLNMFDFTPLIEKLTVPHVPFGGATVSLDAKGEDKGNIAQTSLRCNEFNRAEIAENNDGLQELLAMTLDAANESGIEIAQKASAASVLSMFKKQE